MIKKILNIYIGILILVPIAYTYVLFYSRDEAEIARARGEDVMGDCSGTTLILVPLLIILSILTIIGIFFLKKTNNSKVLAIVTSLITLFPISFYLLMIYVIAGWK